MPYFSIITASYNYANYIVETMDSVLAQTYQDWELIVVDDGSKDNSVEVIKSYCQKDSRIKLFQHEFGINKGLIATIKLGIEKASSDWIAFVESDDFITPDYLEKKLPNVKEDYTEPILTINGTDEIRSKVIEIIRNAKKEIFLEIWSQDFKYIENNLLDAYNRGLDIKIVGYDNFDCMFGTVFRHSGAREIEHSIGGRMVFITADNEEGLFGKIESKKNENVACIWTKNEDIVFLMKEFIVHDIYLLDIEEQFPEQLRYFYGKGWKRLKDKVLGAHSKFNIH